LQKQVQDLTTWAESRPNGSAILARNPFDSVTGPLDGRDDSTSLGLLSQENQENPYADPACDSGRVLLITTSNDANWSFAAIAIGNEKASLRRIGDGVGDRTVYAMVWDRVWMMKSGIRCQLQLQGKPFDSDETIRRSPPRKPLVPREIAEKIHPISDARYDVDRTVIESILEKQGELFRTVRIIPTRDADGASLKLGGIKQGSLLGLLGLVNGDKLHNINGLDMGDPMIAMQGYSRLLTADKLDVRVVRAGKPMSIEINLR
jgi:general secretion pathway protein C